MKNRPFVQQQRCTSTFQLMSIIGLLVMIRVLLNRVIDGSVSVHGLCHILYSFMMY